MRSDDITTVTPPQRSRARWLEVMSRAREVARMTHFRGHVIALVMRALDVYEELHGMEHATATKSRASAPASRPLSARVPGRRSEGTGPSSAAVPTAKERRIGEPAGMAGRGAGGETHRRRDRGSPRDRAGRCDGPPPGVRQRPDPVASG